MSSFLFSFWPSLILNHPVYMPWDLCTWFTLSFLFCLHKQGRILNPHVLDCYHLMQLALRYNGNICCGWDFREEILGVVVHIIPVWTWLSSVKPSWTLFSEPFFSLLWRCPPLIPVLGSHAFNPNTGELETGVIGLVRERNLRQEETGVQSIQSEDL